MIAGTEIKINGQLLDRSVDDELIEVRFEDNLRLPDTFLIRVADPELERVDLSPLEIGAEVEILFAAAGAKAPTSVLKGQITAIETEFAAGQTVLSARGYDYSHALNRTRRTRDWPNKTAGDIAKKVTELYREVGLQPGNIDTGGPVHAFVQQTNETDWEFLWRLAAAIDFEVVVTDKQLHFRTAGRPGAETAAGPEAPPLRWGDNLLSFGARATGVQQVEEVVVRGWDPSTRETIEKTAKRPKLESEIGLPRHDASEGLKGGTHTVADRPVMTADEAEVLAQSVVSQLANAYIEAEGTCKGDPGLRAGTRVKVECVGKNFGGVYMLSATTHTFVGGKGYTTSFKISGSSPRSLLDLMTPAARPNWSGSVAIGVVTQNRDPDGLGRVRVRYPALGADNEGWWARIATPAAGKDRGVLMMPVVGDEVLVAFEHGDARKPYVIGSLWNGRTQPGDLVHSNGSFALKSDEMITLRAKGDVAIAGDKDLTIETDGKASKKAGGEMTVEGQSVRIKAQTSLTIEATGRLEIKAANISLSASGLLQASAPQVLLG